MTSPISRTYSEPFRRSPRPRLLTRDVEAFPTISSDMLNSAVKRNSGAAVARSVAEALSGPATDTVPRFEWCHFEVSLSTAFIENLM